MILNTFRDASLWASHRVRVNTLYVDGHAGRSGATERNGAAKQTCNAATSGIKGWQLEDGSDAIMP